MYIYTLTYQNLEKTGFLRKTRFFKLDIPKTRVCSRKPGFSWNTMKPCPASSQPCFSARNIVWMMNDRSGKPTVKDPIPTPEYPLFACIWVRTWVRKLSERPIYGILGLAMILACISDCFFFRLISGKFQQFWGQSRWPYHGLSRHFPTMPKI